MTQSVSSFKAFWILTRPALRRRLNRIAVGFARGFKKKGKTKTRRRRATARKGKGATRIFTVL